MHEWGNYKNGTFLLFSILYPGNYNGLTADVMEELQQYNTCIKVKNQYVRHGEAKLMIYRFIYTGTVHLFYNETCDSCVDGI